MNAYRKLVVAVVGAVGIAVAQGLLPDVVGDWLTVVIPVLTAAGVYVAPNEP